MHKIPCVRGNATCGLSKENRLIIFHREFTCLTGEMKPMVFLILTCGISSLHGFILEGDHASEGC